MQLNENVIQLVVVFVQLTALDAAEQKFFDRELYIGSIPRRLFKKKKKEGCSSEVDYVVSMHRAFGSRLFSTVKMISKCLELVTKCLQ